MEPGTFLVILLIMFYVRYIISILKTKNRKSIQEGNIKLDEMRKKPIKTLEEQKQFISIKYPEKIGTFKFRWKSIPKFIFLIIIYVLVFKLFYWFFDKVNFEISIIQALLLIIIIPLILNWILRKFNLQNSSDISMLFKWK